MHPIEYFDRIDGLYWFCCDYHGGQACELYRLLSIVSRIYSPSRLATGPATDSAYAYYDHLREKLL